MKSPGACRDLTAMFYASWARTFRGGVTYRVRPSRKSLDTYPLRLLKKHRLPDGSLTSAPSSETLKALPLTPEPNAGVESGISRPFKHIHGFTGVFASDNATVNGFETEPPDQGLAVHDSVVAEINNILVQFFQSDGTPLTNPIAASAFFLAEGAFLSDTQAFFDPKSKRWFFDILVSQGSFNGFGLAVSKTSDPLGEYFIYHLREFSDDIPSCNCSPDFPKAGYNADAFFITANLFIGKVGIYVLPKKKLEAGADFNYIRFLRVDEFVVQPSVPAPGEPFATANNGTEYFLEALNPTFTIARPTVRVIAIYNTEQIISAPGNLQQISIDVLSDPYDF